jgi:hypothetical protein
VTRRALGLHLTLAIVLPGFGALTWWQVGRAISGNTLSYVYSFEWPLFAAYAIYLWWKLVHEAPTPDRPPASPATTDDATSLAAPPAGTDAAPVGSRPSDEAPHPRPEPHQEPVDDELAAYNRYLADLAASGQRKQLFPGRRPRDRHHKQKT